MFEIGESSENPKRIRQSIDSNNVTAQAKSQENKQNLRNLNMRCNPERFCELVSFLNEEQKRWVKQMGFGHLIRLSLLKVDRDFGFWLMKRFDPERRCLHVRDNYSIRVVADYVGWIMGIPGPDMLVPTNISKEKLSLLKGKYGIDESTLFDAMVHGNLPELEFKQSFLLYSLGVLLCPAQSSKISPMHLKVLSTAQNADNYNWCQYVFDWLIRSALHFKDPKSQAGGYGGCTIFLMIFYLDRINIGYAVNWSPTSCRVDAWDHESYRYAIEKDKKSSEEFGNAEFLPNVIYGHDYPIGPAKIGWEGTRSVNAKEEGKKTCALVAWTPPPVDYTKLNIDGSVIDSNAAAGGLLRDHHGFWIAGYSMNIGPSSIHESRLWGLRQGLFLALQLGIRNIVVESDSSDLVKILDPSECGSRPSSALLLDCQGLLLKFELCRICYTLREGNAAADFLAKLGHQLDHGVSYFDVAPEGLLPFLNRDIQGLMP